MSFEVGGRLESKEWDHIEKYPYSSVCGKSNILVEKELVLPEWHLEHDQMAEGACVGFGSVMTLSIMNDEQCRRQGVLRPNCRYNPWWVWNEAKKIDEYKETNPGDNKGTTVKAAMTVLRDIGAVIWDGTNKEYYSDYRNDFSALLYKDAGIQSTRWAVNVEEVRVAINNYLPVTIGVNWYNKFDEPELYNEEYWIGRSKIGYARGGHCVTLYAASDSREAVRIKNSWGVGYPDCWLPYSVLQRLLNENGEAALITDR